MSQIQQYLKMESQEEKAFLILKNQRENEQKEVLRKKMKEFDSAKQDKKYQTVESSFKR
jgi:DNA-binding transcriptional MerR regulator